MVIHQRKHPNLDVDGCYGCKISTVNLNSETLARARDGRGASGGGTDREYVKRMFEKRREAGLADPVPLTSEAAALAPAAGPIGNTKKYREANGGL